MVRGIVESRRIIAGLALLGLLGALLWAASEGPLGGPRTSPTPTPTVGASSTATPTVGASVTATPTAGPTSLPVDQAIAPVSRSSPNPEAAEVIRLCLNETIPIERIERMGLVPSARDLPRYVPLTGREPWIKTDEPAWVVQFRGEIPMLLSGEVWTDPICLVIGGEPGYVGTGPVRNLTTGALHTPEPPASPPDRALPTLAP
ncbi:MAG: hypothetical protein A2X23_11670 [Chloroflexi bacterium GWC2_73_18]|nr:MAG: hypothetical protein A2X23_11670 [Chloroflexi bacterium GWC2_73_18]